MAGSRRSPPPDGGSSGAVRRAVGAILGAALPCGGSVAVALSGGRDSMALLDASARFADARHRLVAFHVHHGLSVDADAWTAFCANACAARGVAFAMHKVFVRAAGVGIEASAREARYRALAALAREHEVDAVLLAHHADDQAETMLLQLARGAGPRGLAGMPAVAKDRGVQWLRPFLSLPRAVIDDYVRSHAIAYVDDDSNAATDFRRNALRADVVPALRRIAPGYPLTLARAAGLQAEAAALLDDLALLDGAHACDGNALDLATLRSLAPARARNLLRWFLRERGLRSPSAARLGEILRQLRGATADARVLIEHDRATIGIHRGRAVVHTPATAGYERRWGGEREIALPHGVLAFTPACGEGIAARRLAESGVTVRAGEHGERLRVSAGGGRRNVADLLREAGVPPWERLGLPRLYCGDALVAVARAGIDAAFAAQSGEPGIVLDWRPART
jgi:tRNA(Ile)-lysidine synthase